ncbi:C40 family peptidase [Thermobrachium celere]|uniref:Endopeptidase, cell wall lytic activity n=1 Tax=Thermobrachium celere DSM 8682 TaxID=941824 RepID=R7RRX9_9CLOT|nr:C40 family peptidase [Thermobrachium celere]CDF58131.1 endopeptidase, cell wall lytic activity [Thermobrachium celere DSM 8682]
MNKKLISLSLALALTFTSFPIINVQAAKKSTRQSRKITSTRRITKTRKTVKKNLKRSASRGRIYSRGSGSVLAEGNVSELINIALSLQGIRYRYGGTTLNGFDCSGFTQYVYRQIGVNIPRTASEQAQVGLAVSKESLRPGDLVFFETVRAGISHVGIYIGNGQFIHASSGSSYKVKISDLNSSYYKPRYRGAVRIIK